APDDHFFQLGGQSLAASRIAALLRQRHGLDVSIAMVLRYPTLRDFAAQLSDLAASSGGEPGPWPRPDRRAAAPAPSAVRRIWLEEAFQDGRPTYTVVQGFRLRGRLDEQAFTTAVGELFARHDALRATVEDDGAELRLLVAPVVSDPLRVLPAVDSGAMAQRLRDLVRAESERTFDLAKAPLVVMTLMRLGAGEWALVLCAHHAVVDGRSLAILWRDLVTAYTAAQRGAPPWHEPPALTLTDYAWWEHERRPEREASVDMAYWTPLLADLPGTGTPAPESDADRVGQHRLHLGPRTFEQLRAVAADTGHSVFLLLLSTFQAAFAAQVGPDDTLVGVQVTTHDGRTEEVVGPLINQVPVRVRDLRGATPVMRADRVAGAWRAALEHAHVPFDIAVRKVGVAAGAAGRPRIDVGFSYLDASDIVLALPGVAVEPLDLPHNGTAKYPLFVEAVARPQGIDCAIEYQTGSHSSASVRALCDAWEALVVDLLAGQRPGPGERS
ncbi:MAG TPA: condensation domain-containing protein, partial [Rugosimonospora sp.]|nr:condensation domain-containing protein [Rugosimonospora sp.]